MTVALIKIARRGLHKKITPKNNRNQKKTRWCYRGFERKGARLLGHNIIVIPQRY
jgi:hypothetical protein